MIAPNGLITFGVNHRIAANWKPYGTHMDIVLREWGKGNGPIVPFLGVAVEGVYGIRRQRILDAIYERVGSEVVTMALRDNSVNLSIQGESDNGA